MSDMFSPSLPREYFNAQNQRTYYLNPYTQRYITNASYARRLQRGFDAGISQSEARGHRRSARGLSESQERRARAEERGDLSPYQRFLGGFERRYNISYRDWRYLYNKYIREINLRAWPQATSPRMQFGEDPDGPEGNQDGDRKDPRVFPGDIGHVRWLYENGYRPTGMNSPATWLEWAEIRLAVRLDTLIEFQDNHNSVPGKSAYASRDATWMRMETPMEAILGRQLGVAATAPPIELWWYH